MTYNRRYELALFVALMSTALALGAALAHLLELPNKIGLPRDQYFLVQAIYRGWNQLAYLLAVQFGSIVAVIGMSRQRPSVFRSALLACVALIAAQLVFWTTTYPANVATNDWTTIPENWETLRRQWEYSHAVGAAFQAVAMAGLIIAALLRAR
jgi:hypothetical protein